MKAVVTGGAGFIGSHIAEALCHEGMDVCVLDDESCGNGAKLAWQRPSDRLEYVRGDIRNAELLRKVLAGASWVFHHAAVASVPASVADPAGTNSVNLDATLHLLLAARDANVQRLLFASSSAVYGEGNDQKRREDDPTQPSSPYGLQKLAAEKYCVLAESLYGVPTVCFRYFNVFGPRQSFDSPYSGVIARFCTAAIQGEAATIFGDGQQSRDFIHISNVVRANLTAAKAPAAAVAGQVFNIGSGNSVTVERLYETTARLAGSSVPARREPARAGDIRHSCADISRAQAAFGYRVGIGFEEGLRDTLDFYRQTPRR
jgi:nucleoside-diphosphate-sugar epimerase